MEKIYVIVPAYNAEAFLESAVESVLQQQYKNVHVVVIDDGSSDRTLEIARSLEVRHTRIKVLTQKNSGVSIARNAGIEYVLSNALSEDVYLAFLDSDDLWHPDYLTNKLIEELASEQHDIYAFSMLNCNEKAKRYSSPRRYEKKTSPGGNSGIWTITNHFASCLYRISLFKKWNIRFFPSYRYSEDKYFRLQCAFFAKSIQLRPELMYIYRENSSGTMKKANRIEAIDYYLPIINGWLESDRFINSWSHQTGVTTDCGHSLATIYFLDMAVVHCMQQRKNDEIMKTLKEHPHYSHFIETKPENIGNTYIQKRQLLLEHPIMFGMKYRILGLLTNWLREVSYWKPFRWIIQHKKYPLSNLPQN